MSTAQAGRGEGVEADARGPAAARDPPRTVGVVVRARARDRSHLCIAVEVLHHALQESSMTRPLVEGSVMSGTRTTRLPVELQVSGRAPHRRTAVTDPAAALPRGRAPARLDGEDGRAGAVCVQAGADFDPRCVQRRVPAPAAVIDLGVRRAPRTPAIVKRGSQLAFFDLPISVPHQRAVSTSSISYVPGRPTQVDEVCRSSSR